MTDKELFGWIQARTADVKIVMENESDKDKLDRLHILEETVRRIKLAIEKRLEVTDKPHQSYCVPWRIYAPSQSEEESK